MLEVRGIVATRAQGRSARLPFAASLTQRCRALTLTSGQSGRHYRRIRLGLSRATPCMHRTLRRGQALRWRSRRGRARPSIIGGPRSRRRCLELNHIAEHQRTRRYIGAALNERPPSSSTSSSIGVTVCVNVDITPHRSDRLRRGHVRRRSSTAPRPSQRHESIYSVREPWPTRGLKAVLSEQ